MADIDVMQFWFIGISSGHTKTGLTRFKCGLEHAYMEETLKLNIICINIINT